MKRPIIFEHIPKTAGSTLNNILHRQYQRIFAIESLHPLDSVTRFRALPRHEREGFQLIRGHGASLLIDDVKAPVLVTMLREPVSRFISQYNFIRTNFEHRNSAAVRELSFVEYLDHAQAFGEDNLQVRFLSSLLRGTLAGNPGEVREMHLEEAKDRLLRFDHVLGTEWFDPSVLRLKRGLGWKKPPVYKRQNITPRGVRLRNLSAEDLAKVRESEGFDLRLYDWCKERFFLSLAEVPVGTYHLQNRLYLALRAPYDWVRSLNSPKLHA